MFGCVEVAHVNFFTGLSSRKNETKIFVLCLNSHHQVGRKEARMQDHVVWDTNSNQISAFLR